MSILNRKAPILTREEYLRLARIHHPDNGGNVEDFKHVQLLYSDDYVPPDQVKFGNIRYTYTAHPIPSMYVGNNTVLFQTPVPTPSLSFTFPDQRIKDEMSKYLPVFVKQTSDYVVVGKPKNTFSARQYLDQLSACPWIISSLYNLLCYLQVTGITHNDISVDNVFFNPDGHSAHLLGGWWYSRPAGSVLSVLPQATFQTNPKLAKAKVASHAFDLGSIKRLGLELMGDRSGMSLDRSSEKVRFLRLPSTGSAISDYRAWIACLGTRKFVKMEFKP